MAFQAESPQQRASRRAEFVLRNQVGTRAQQEKRNCDTNGPDEHDVESLVLSVDRNGRLCVLVKLLCKRFGNGTIRIQQAAALPRIVRIGEVQSSIGSVQLKGTSGKYESKYWQ